jgi:hypothetical protein
VAVEIVELLGSLLTHKPIQEPGKLLAPTLVVRSSS